MLCRHPCSNNSFSGTGVSPVQAQAKACAYYRENGGQCPPYMTLAGLQGAHPRCAPIQGGHAVLSLEKITVCRQFALSRQSLYGLFRNQSGALTEYLENKED